MNFTVFAKVPGGEMMRFDAFDMRSHEEAISRVKQELPAATVLVDILATPPIQGKRT